MRRLKEVSGWSCEGGKTNMHRFFFSSRRRHTRYWRDWEFRRVLFRSRASDRERGHIAAGRLWADGDLAGAVEAWGRTAIEHPRDGLAIQFAHIGDFALGYSHMLRDRVARALPHWRGAPGQGFILGMHAFGLEESGDYAAAEEAGRKALTLDRQDGWAAHAARSEER